MINEDNFDCLTKSFKKTVETLSISEWNQFARFTASELVNLKSIQISDLKNIFMRLDQRGLHISLTGKETDNYCQSHFSGKTSLELYKDLMATSVRKTFMYYNRVIRTLENNHIYTLGDLSRYPRRFIGVFC